jgi:hypothetical protein
LIPLVVDTDSSASFLVLDGCQRAITVIFNWERKGRRRKKTQIEDSRYAIWNSKHRTEFLHFELHILGYGRYWYCSM